MPYIECRKYLSEKLDELKHSILTSGELNFCITKLIHNWLLQHGVSYSNFNSMVGVLECAKLELYRQVVATYEDRKKAENGAISELDSKTLEDVR